MSQNATIHATTHPDIRPALNTNKTEQEREDVRRAEPAENARASRPNWGNRAAREPSQISLDRAAEEGMIAPDDDDPS